MTNIENVKLNHCQFNVFRLVDQIETESEGRRGDMRYGIRLDKGAIEMVARKPQFLREIMHRQGK